MFVTKKHDSFYIIHFNNITEHFLFLLVNWENTNNESVSHAGRCWESESQMANYW